jgi:hypothetical protein
MHILKFKTLVSVCSLLGLVACAKKYTPANLPPTQLHFGSGGGFTGKETDYLLLENGQVFFKEPFSKTHIALGKIKPKAAKGFYKQIVAFQTTQINRPSNQYQFIRLQKQDTTYRFVFSEGGSRKDSLSQSMIALFDQMMIAMPKTMNNEASH